MRAGRSELNYAVYHDRYRRKPDGWKFTERVYEVRYLDTTALPGTAAAERGEDEVPWSKQPAAGSSLAEGGALT
jgi:hypothetical protein